MNANAGRFTKLTKLALIFFGLLFLVCIWLGRRQSQPLPETEGEKITVEDVEILLDALGVSSAFSKADGAEQLPESWQTGGGEAGEEAVYLTYGQYEEICRRIEKEEWQLPDLRDRYEPEQALLKKDWYSAFRILLAYLDTESSIWETTVFVLKTDAGKAEAYTENGALQGPSAYRSSAFADSALQELKVYVQGNTLLTIVEVLPDDHYLGSVWVMETSDGVLDCFYHQTAFQAYISDNENIKIPEREQIVNLTIRAGKIVGAEEKTEKIHGKLLRASGQEMEIEGHGIYEVAQDMEVYKLYGSLKTLGLSDLRVGFSDTDYVVEKGKVYACLVSEAQKADLIRVLLKNTASGGNFHKEVGISVDGEKIHIRADQMTVGERRSFRSENLTDKVTLELAGSARADHDYRGTVECLRTEQGIVVINELPLEEYLYAVVPSEMPASYPEEALKAQAVCARTYAYRYILHAGLLELGAHVDDTTAYQVYHNIGENAATTTAVKETDGVLLTYQGEAAGNYYYSTSCGAGTDVESWQGGGAENVPYMQAGRISLSSADGGEDADAQSGTAVIAGGGEEPGAQAQAGSVQPGADSLQEEAVFREFITTVHPEDLEKEEPWYRWKYRVEELDEKKLAARLKERYAKAPACILTKTAGDYYVAEPIGKLGKIKNLSVTKRGAGGIAREITIEAERAVVKVLSEYNIRYVLCDGKSQAVRQDDSAVNVPTLLPSGFFVLDPVFSSGNEGENVVGYTLSGGGYGHGVGMSQNGARAFANEDASYEQILGLFYPGCELMHAEELEEG